MEGNVALQGFTIVTSSPLMLNFERNEEPTFFTDSLTIKTFIEVFIFPFLFYLRVSLPPPFLPSFLSLLPLSPPFLYVLSHSPFLYILSPSPPDLFSSPPFPPYLSAHL